VNERTARENPAFFKAAMQLQVRSGARVLRASTPEGVELCRELGAAPLVVWGALGPSGKLLQLKESREDELLDHYGRRGAALAQARPDALFVHSMADVEEAVLALQALRRCCALPVGVSVTLGSGPEGLDTVLGLTCEQVMERLEPAGADFIGVNCRLPVDELVLAVRLMHAGTSRPLVAFPDAGQPELDGPRIVYRESPEDFAAKAVSLHRAGARIIGGCCGVSAEHIKALADVFSAERHEPGAQRRRSG
jgi:5-methyltetrahydrofolate--homocysteine methyltransferase